MHESKVHNKKSFKLHHDINESLKQITLNLNPQTGSQSLIANSFLFLPKYLIKDYLNVFL